MSAHILVFRIQHHTTPTTTTWPQESISSNKTRGRSYFQPHHPQDNYLTTILPKIDGIFGLKPRQCPRYHSLRHPTASRRSTSVNSNSFYSASSGQTLTIALEAADEAARISSSDVNSTDNYSGPNFKEERGFPSTARWLEDEHHPWNDWPWRVYSGTYG